MDEQNNRARLRQNLLSNSQSAYLNMTALVQGAAMGFLGYQITIALAGNVDRLIWLHVLYTGIVVVLVWQEYVTQVSTFVFIPSLIDWLILLGFGVVQSYMASTIRETYIWYWWSLGIPFVAIFAYINQFLKSRSNKDYKQLLKYLGIHAYLPIILTIATCILFGLLPALLAFLQSSDAANLALVIILCLVTTMFALYGWWRWNKIVVYILSEE